MKLFVCIFDDARLFRHLMRHYVRFGIEEFHVAVPPRFADQVARASEGCRVVQYSDLDVADSYTGGISAVTRMRELAQAPDEWVAIVDLDEFVEFGRPVSEIVADMEREGANLAPGIMYDRIAASGQPTAFHDDSDLPSLYPVRARLIKELMRGVDRKGVLVKGHLQGSGAHHDFQYERPYSQVFEISHYKWFDGSLERVRRAYEMNRDAGRTWADQYKRILDHYAEHGRLAWETFGGEIRTS